MKRKIPEVAIWTLSGCMGFVFAIALAHALIALGEMKSELKRNDGILNSIDGKLDALDGKFSGIVESQFRMERKLDALIRFMMK